MDRITKFFLWLVIAAALYAFWEVAQAQGVASSSVDQSNVGSTICVAGYTDSVRPPASYTNGLKRRLMRSQKLSGTPADYELDHLISLELGGHPTDERNLWMQPYEGKCNARDKDRLETRLKRLVCTGHITLHQAQHEIATDWVASYNKRIGPLACN